MEDISKFSLRWIQENWQEAYNVMTQRVNSVVDCLPTEQFISPPSPLELDSEHKEPSLDETSEELREIEQEVKTLEAGKLEGWKIFYTRNPYIKDEKYWDELEGETLPEREKALAEYVVSNHISCTVNPSVIIGHLEAVVSSPPQYEYTSIKQKFGNQVFIKKKKGDIMRVFHYLDRDSQTIVFFLYKKEDWKYRKI